jgi:hypothetical protein
VLHEALASQLDPIDWATYEPYLWNNVARCYQRSAVLLGSLVQLKRLHAGKQPPPRPFSLLTHPLPVVG